jgi:hypothetical protein
MSLTPNKEFKVALIGDMVQSRLHRQRDQLQQTLGRCLENVNGVAKATLASPYTITLGDEFQALYHSAQGILTHICMILGKLYPTKCRFALGIGAITTQIVPTAAIGMDGPAFYLARNLIEQLKREGEVIGVCSEDNSQLGLENETLKYVFNQLNDQMKIKTSQQKMNRFDFITDFLNDMPVKAIAANNGISKTRAYQVIAQMHLTQVKRIMVLIEAAMQRAL